MNSASMFRILLVALVVSTSEGLIDEGLVRKFAPVRATNSSEGNRSCLPIWKDLKSWDIIRYKSNGCEKSAKLLLCYCITAINTSSTAVEKTELKYYAGHCIYGCLAHYTQQYREVTIDGILNNELCASFKRKGLLCGECEPGYGTPVYSFTLNCIPCHNRDYVALWKQILLYIAVGYGPMTLFLIFIIVFTVSVNSIPLHGFIFVSQIMTTNLYLTTVSAANNHHLHSTAYIIFKICVALYGICNLDFFRVLYKPFCIHPHMNTIQVRALDYLVAAYPLAVILVLYALVELHSRGCKIVVVLWKPFRYCYARFRHQLNIRTSLVDAFGTFLSLFYVKMLNTAVNLMIPNKVWDSNNTITEHVFFYGTMKFFGTHHLPFALLSIFIVIVCNILPLFLILVYSIPKAQVILRCFPASLHRTLYPFMDSILGCYKNGTNNTRNCRYFAVVYYIARFFIWTLLMWTKTSFYYVLVAAITAFISLLVAIIQPYKSSIYNKVDAFLIFNVALASMSIAAYTMTLLIDPINKRLPLYCGLALYFVPLLYIVGYSCYSVCIVKKLPQRSVTRCIHIMQQKLKTKEINEFTALVN